MIFNEMAPEATPEEIMAREGRLRQIARNSMRVKRWEEIMAVVEDSCAGAPVIENPEARGHQERALVRGGCAQGMALCAEGENGMTEPPPTGTMNCPICGSDKPHAHYATALPEPLTPIQRRDELHHAQWRAANNVRLEPETVLQIIASYEATVVALEHKLATPPASTPEERDRHA